MGFQAFFGMADGKVPIPLLPECGACGLYKNCHSPRMPVYGDGKKGILLVSDYPGEKEDFANRPFVDKAGSILRESLARNGVSLATDCWSTNALICKPDSNVGLEKKAGHCQPNIVRVLDELKPKIVIPMGKYAIQSVLSLFWDAKMGKDVRWWGWQIPSQRRNCWICPTFNPAALLYKQGANNEVMELFWNQYIKGALRIQNRPWQTVPDWQKNVRVVLDPTQAAYCISHLIHQGKPVAWDYETNMIKPDSDKARILAVSFCNGKHAFACPWSSRVERAMQKFIRSPLPKIAANLKFEERWTRAILGRGVRNWIWDTMIMAHILDNRRGITGLKFQSFVRLGQPYYAGAVDKYTHSTSSNTPNRLHEANIQEMLLYNGLDSLLTYRLYLRQS